MDPTLAATAFFAVVCLAWLGIVVPATIGLVHMPRLPDLRDAPPARVSVILAARDEQTRIEQTVRRALAQLGVDHEVIVADDRSTDETPAILGALAREQPHLRVVRIDELPAGWLGKCHALHAAAAHATGDILVFIDADTWLTDTAVARAVALASRLDAKHLCLAPSHASTTLPGRAALLAGTTLLGVRAFFLNRDLPTGYMGIGAFNMIDAALYRSFGAHEPLRLEIVDDVKLGMLARKAGARSRLAFASHDVEVEWAGSARSLVAVLRKNAFATQNFSIVRTTLLALVAMLCLLAPIAAPVALALAERDALRLAAACALGAYLATIVPGALGARSQRWGLAGALLSPLAYWIILFAGVNSAARTLLEGGVRWRDTFYPLAQLRRGVVR